jgi:hypothetical protein
MIKDWLSPLNITLLIGFSDDQGINYLPKKNIKKLKIVLLQFIMLEQSHEKSTVFILKNEHIIPTEN